MYFIYSVSMVFQSNVTGKQYVVGHMINETSEKGNKYLIDKAVVEVNNYRSTYGLPVDGEIKLIANYINYCTVNGY